MARLGGMQRDALSAQRSLQESVWRRLVHRLPWLVVGLLGMLRRVIRQELLTGLTATAVAIGLPWLLHRLGSDPAFGSGPLATVIQDLLSILIYLSVARALMP